MRLAIIADDLTGAADTGVQLRKWGLSVGVLIGLEALSGAFERFDIVVVDTESRADPPETAYDKAAEAAGRLTSLGADRIYKKVDSTLRGNLGAELDAVMDAAGADMAFVAPAYPANGRTTVDGCQLVHGARVDETEYAGEMGVGEAHIPTLMEIQSRRRVGQVGLETVRKGVEALKRRVEALEREGVEVVVFDAVAERDLAVIAMGARDMKVVAGSAGLASELPPALGLRRVKPVLSICGSTRSPARRQARALTERLGCLAVDVDASRLMEGGAPYGVEVGRCIREASDALKSGIDVCIASAPEEDSAERALSVGLGLGMDGAEVRSRVEEALATIALTVLEGVEVSGLVLTGGATALRLCEALKVEEAEVLEEVQPGIPLLALADGLKAVTKAGGFGGEDALVEAVKHLRRVSSS